MKNIFIYVLIDPRDGRVRYVGLTRDLQARMRRHRWDKTNPHRRRWFELLNAINLEPTMLAVFTTSEERCDEDERMLIAYYRASGCDLLNATDGGERGYKPSDETRRSIGEKSRARMLGTKQSAETRAKRSLAMKGVPRPYSREIMIRYNKSCIGKKLTLEHRQKCSIALTGRKLSMEQRHKLSQAAIRREANKRTTISES